MKTEKYLEKIKKEYLKINPSPEFESFGWESLSLSAQDATRTFKNYMARAVLITSAVMVFLSAFMFGLIQAAQASLPGEPLYPIKRLYEDIIFNKPEQKKEKAKERVSEIIEAVNRKKDKKTIEKSINEYKKTIQKAEKGISGDDKDDLRKSLKEQEKRLREEIKDNSELKDKIEKATNTVFEKEDAGELLEGKKESKSEKLIEIGEDDNEGESRESGR